MATTVTPENLQERARGAFDDVEDGFGIQVALGCCLTAQRIRFVGESDVKAIAIGIGIDSDRRHAELP